MKEKINRGWRDIKWMRRTNRQTERGGGKYKPYISMLMYLSAEKVYIYI